MSIFGSKKSSSNNGKPRRSSPQRNESLLKKLRSVLSEVDRLDNKISNLDKQLAAIPKEKLTRAKKELLSARRLNFVGQRNELLVKVEAIKATIAQSNEKNLAIVQSKVGTKNK